MVRRKIETTSHYSRDVTFGEDKSRIRSNPGVFARLRSFAFNILKSSETSTLCQDRYRAALAGIDNLLEILAIPSGITEGPISRPVLRVTPSDRNAHPAQRGTNREGLCQAGRSRSLQLLRPQPARWVPDISGRVGGGDLQDDGPVPT
jgi:hypothetical protein